MTGPHGEAGVPGAPPVTPGHAVATACPGCGRMISLPHQFPGGRFLCARCHYPQGSPGAGRGVIPGTWFRAVCLGGLAAVASAGVSLCVLYLAGTGRGTWFALLLLSMSLTVALPLGVYRRRRNLYILVSALYFPLGLWCFIWYLAPGVGWDYSSSLLGGGFFFLVLGAGALYLYDRDLRSLPRW